jgi:hypothetical protein
MPPMAFGMAALRGSGLVPRPCAALRAAGFPMTDLIYLVAGAAILGAFILYTLALKRI